MYSNFNLDLSLTKTLLFNFKVQVFGAQLFFSSAQNKIVTAANASSSAQGSDPCPRFAIIPMILVMNYWVIIQLFLFLYLMEML